MTVCKMKTRKVCRVSLIKCDDWTCYLVLCMCVSVLCCKSMSIQPGCALQEKILTKPALLVKCAASLSCTLSEDEAMHYMQKHHCIYLCIIARDLASCRQQQSATRSQAQERY